MKKYNFVFSLFFSLILIFATGSIAEACPSCKLALEEGSNHSQQGYAYSILFMMAMPFAIATGWTIFIVRSVIQQRKLQEMEGADSVAILT